MRLCCNLVLTYLSLIHFANDPFEFWTTFLWDSFGTTDQHFFTDSLSLCSTGEASSPSLFLFQHLSLSLLFPLSTPISLSSSPSLASYSLSSIYRGNWLALSLSLSLPLSFSLPTFPSLFIFLSSSLSPHIPIFLALILSLPSLLLSLSLFL